MRKITCIINFILLSTFLSAQDPWFSNPGNSINWINPAFVNDTAMVVRTSARVQWPEINPLYLSFTNFSMYLRKINSWIGASYMHADYNNVIQDDQYSIYYIKQFRTGKNSSLRIAADLYYLKRRLNTENLIFGDMIDPRAGIIYPTGNNVLSSSSILDFSSGLLFNWKNVFLGFSGFHISELRQSLKTGSTIKSMRSSAQVGANFTVKSDSLHITVQPYLKYDFQNSSTLQAGARLILNKIELLWNTGLGNRFSSLGTGLKMKNIRVNYAYTWFPENNFGGAHEIGFAFRFHEAQHNEKHYFFNAGAFSSY
jgi:type IX secretion system PorP/SprF family membrane protein